jgi:hypothetical protein
MQKTLSGQSIGEAFPQVDLTATVADGLVLPLLNREVFSTMHALGHNSSYLFSLGHSAVELSANATFEDPSHIKAMMLGCSAFELLSNGVRPRGYQSEEELAVVYGVLRCFTKPELVEEFASRAAYAGQRLHDDTPVLHDAIAEVAENHLGYNEADVLYAITGAGMMRGMQIRTDRILAA